METILFREATFDTGKVVLNYAEGPGSGFPLADVFRDVSRTGQTLSRVRREPCATDICHLSILHTSRQWKTRPAQDAIQLPASARITPYQGKHGRVDVPIYSEDRDLCSPDLRVVIHDPHGRDQFRCAADIAGLALP